MTTTHDISDPVERLLALKAAARSRRFSSEPLASWVEQFVDAVLVEGADPREALGMRATQGQRLPNTAWLEALRNERIVHASRLAGGAAELAEEVQRFIGYQLISWARKGRAPEGATPLQKVLFEASRYGHLPTSARQIRRIIKRT